MGKLITNPQIKKALYDAEKSECVDLIAEIADACPQAREFLTIRFSSSDNMVNILLKYKQKVEYEFYPQRGYGRLNLREAKKAITDFKRICSDKVLIIDLMLFYVENCVEFTKQYGDINEAFYNSALSVFSQVITAINKTDEKTYRLFAERLQSAVNNALHGWGFYDGMYDLYNEIEWCEDE